MSRRHFAAGLNRSSATKSKGSQSRSRAERSQQKSERFVNRQMMIRQRSETRREKYINAFKRAGSAFRMWWLTLLGVMTKVVRPIVGKSLVQRGPVRRSNRPEKAFDGASRAVEFLEAKTLLTSLYVDEAVDFAPASPFANDAVIWVGADNAVGGGDDKNVTFEPTAGLVAGGLDGAAYDSIQDAINAASPGDTIYVAAGSYSNIVIDKQLTLLSVGGAASTTINGPNANQGAAIRVAAGVQGVVIGGAGQGFTLNAVGLDLAALYLVEDNDGATVSGNVINGGTAHAVLMGGKQDGVTVTGNTINGDGPIALVYVNGVASLGPGQESTNVDITNNTINGGAGAGLLLGLEGASGDVTGNTFTGNASYAQLEVFGASNVITGNSFNAAGTPFVDGASNYDEADIVDDNTFAASPIYIQGGAFYPTIQAAITAAVASDTIVVAAGTYTGNISVNKSVTIRGANFGIASTGMRGAETVIVGGFDVTANDVVLDGLQIMEGRVDYGFQRSGVFVNGARTGVQLKNSIVDRDGVGSESSLHGLVTTYGAATTLTVSGNSFFGWDQGLYLNPGVTK